MDALSEVLRVCRLRAAVALRAELSSPWALSVAPSAALGKSLLPEAQAARYATGKAYHWLYGDLNSFLAALRRRSLERRSLAGWALDMARRALTSHHLTFDWRDPLPTLHMYWRKFLHAPLRRRLPASRPQPR